jgi:hypothetical protein
VRVYTPYCVAVVMRQFTQLARPAPCVNSLREVTAECSNSSLHPMWWLYRLVAVQLAAAARPCYRKLHSTAMWCVSVCVYVCVFVWLTGVGQQRAQSSSRHRQFVPGPAAVPTHCLRCAYTFLLVGRRVMSKVFSWKVWGDESTASAESTRLHGMARNGPHSLVLVECGPAKGSSLVAAMWCVHPSPNPATTLP